MDSSTAADSNSIRSRSSWTTFSGIGSQSGRFIYGIGNAILHGVEDVTVIQRRISYIKSRCPLSDDNPPEDVERIYNELLELARCALLRGVDSRLGSDHFGADPTSTLSTSESKHYK
jgi:hypothetical protein